MGPKSRTKRKRPANKAPDTEKAITVPLTDPLTAPITVPLSEQSMKEHNESLPPKVLSEFVMLDCSTSSEDLTIADAKTDDSPDFIRRTRRKSAAIAAEAEILCSTSSEPSSLGEDVSSKIPPEQAENFDSAESKPSAEDKYREMMKRIKIIPVKATEHRFGLGGKTSCFVMELFADSDIMATSASEPSLGPLEETASEFMDILPTGCQSDMELTDSLLFSPDALEGSPTCTGEAAQREERSIDFAINAFPPLSVVTITDDSEKEGSSWEGLLQVHLQWHPINKIRSVASADKIPEDKTLTHAVKAYLSQLSLRLKELNNAVPINVHALIGELLAVCIRPNLSAKTKQLPPQQMYFDRLWASYERGLIDTMTELGCHMVEIAEELDAWIQIVHKMTVRTDFGLPWWVQEDEEEGVQISLTSPSATPVKSYEEVTRLIKSKADIVQSVRALQLSHVHESRRKSRFSESGRVKHVEDCKASTSGSVGTALSANNMAPTCTTSYPSTSTVAEDGKIDQALTDSGSTQNSESDIVPLASICTTESAVEAKVHEDATSMAAVAPVGSIDDSNVSRDGQEPSPPSVSKAPITVQYEEACDEMNGHVEYHEEETTEGNGDSKSAFEDSTRKDNDEEMMSIASCSRVNSEMHLLAEVVASDEDAEVPEPPEQESFYEAAINDVQVPTRYSSAPVNAIECMIQEMTSTGSEMIVDE